MRLRYSSIVRHRMSHSRVGGGTLVADLLCSHSMMSKAPPIRPWMNRRCYRIVPLRWDEGT